MENMTIKDALAAGAALTKHQEIDGKKFAVIPEDYKIEDLENLQSSPTRIQKYIRFSDVDSFVRYINKFKNDTTVIYCDFNPTEFMGVIDSNVKDKPSHEEHKAFYKPIMARQFEAWNSKDGQAMSQSDFAAFIEKNLADIVEPAPADMLEVSRSLQAKKSINFTSGIRLSDGSQQLSYEEDIKGTSAKGNIKIPEEFSLALPVFKNGTTYKVNAKFRYRIKDAQLIIWYELLNKEDTLDDAIEGVTGEISSNTDCEIFNIA